MTTAASRPLSARRGFTLVEILIAVTLTLVVGGGIYNAIIGARRLQRTTAARLDTQQSARTAATFLSTTLRELDAYSGDLIAATDSSLRYRAMRWTGMTCTALGGGLTLGLRQTQLWGVGTPSATADSIMVYLERDPNTRNDDIWVIGGLSAVGSGVCPSGGNAVTTTFTIRAADGGNAAVTAGWLTGAPVRGFQHEEVTLIAADGESWLGRRTMAADGTWSSWEPVVGPLEPGSGLRFTMFDSLAVVTTTVSQATSIRIAVRARSRELGFIEGVNSRHRDSMITRVAMRNTLRF